MDDAYICTHGPIEFKVRKSSDHQLGDPVTLAIRPEKFDLCPPSDSIFQGKVTESTYMGTDTYLRIQIDESTNLEVRCQNAHLEKELPTEGELAGIHIAQGAATLLED